MSAQNRQYQLLRLFERVHHFFHLAHVLLELRHVLLELGHILLQLRYILLQLRYILHHLQIDAILPAHNVGGFVDVNKPLFWTRSHCTLHKFSNGHLFGLCITQILEPQAVKWVVSLALLRAEQNLFVVDKVSFVICNSNATAYMWLQ